MATTKLIMMTGNRLNKRKLRGRKKEGPIFLVSALCLTKINVTSEVSLDSALYQVI